MLKPMRTHFRSACVKRCTDAIRHLSPAAITLGVALNTLEAFSLGILIFPSDDRHGVFAGLQTQAMSLFIMSTVISQAVLTMGGSSVPPALSSMLAEALPFLRSIATTIQNNLGSGHPDVLPTTLAAFALSSVALGTVFLLLAALRIGSLVSFFPETVMSGVIGAVGVSLCILGLEIPFPASSPHLNLAALFHRDHIPLLAASVLPALCLSITVRLEILVVGATSWTKHPLYVPLFCIGTAMTFWIVVAASSNTDTTTLWHQGWLFATTIELSTSSAPWDYWSLFDMERIQWSELLSVSKDLATLVAIGALSLPIFGMATVAKVDVSDHSMNHEFIGHGLANVIAGLGGTLPALMIYSNTLFFHRAGGNRGEACIVTLLMLGVFFASSYILPYVPTVTASTLTVFIGMELLIDSLWQSSSSLIWDEWITVAATTLACSIMGFAPGMGVGLALVVGFQFLRTAIQTRPRIIRACTQDKNLDPPRLPPLAEVTTSKTLYEQSALELGDIDAPPRNFVDEHMQRLPSIIRLSRHVGFTDKPLIERCIQAMPTQNGGATWIILDFEDVTTIETSVAEFLQRKACQLSRLKPAISLVASMSRQNAHAHAHSTLAHVRTDAISNFETMGQAVRGCMAHYSDTAAKELLTPQVISCVDSILGFEDPPRSDKETPRENRLLECGFQLRRVASGEAIVCQQYPPSQSFLVLHGDVLMRKAHDAAVIKQQQPIRYALIQAWKHAAVRLRHTRLEQDTEASTKPTPRHLTQGQLYKVDEQEPVCAYANGGFCWILAFDLHSRAGQMVRDWIVSSVHASKY